MPRTLIIAAVAAASALAAATLPAHADFSACASAYAAKDLHQQVDLYTTCLKHGGLMATDVAGAFNNRGIAHERLGEVDLALQDFISATQYDPNWPDFRFNRARAEAQKGQCASALADVEGALKLAPHRREILEFKERLADRCAPQLTPSSAAPPARDGPAS